MQIRIKIPPLIGILILTTLMGTACSSNILSSRLEPAINQATSFQITQGKNTPRSVLDMIPALSDQPSSVEMVAFEGNVFVASTKPIVDRWHQAGWQIAKQSLTGEIGQVPVDCTLYKHLGVQNQWIGSCSGYTFIPKDGASHIAVMQTQPDGTSILVQVAPAPESNEP